MRHAAAPMLLVLAIASPAGAVEPDTYTEMLAYLAESRIDQRAFTGANGAVGINQAAGDLNVQANLRSIAAGEHASAYVRGPSPQAGNVATAPTSASAVIGGQAFNGASGLFSINQASGAANTEVNVVAATLAQQGIREASDDLLASQGLASAGPRHTHGRGATGTTDRKVAIESTALQAFEGVLQLNQIAGSANATENVLTLSVQGGP